MSFLNPLFLIGISIVSIPIIIHLLSRKKPKKIDFSYLKFIEIASRRAIKKFRLRQYLLLLIRCLIIILLSLIFAKPVIRYVSASKDLETILLLDNSYSMDYYKNGKVRLDIAKETIKKTISLLKPYEKITFFSFSDKLIPVVKNPTIDRQIILSELDNIKITYNKTDAFNAITEAVKYFKNTNNEVRIILFSDFAKNGWRDNTDLTNSQNKIIGIDVGENEPENYTVAKVDTINNDITFTISNFSEFDKKLLASLYIDGKKYKNMFFDTNSYKESILTFNLKNLSNGIHKCYLESEPDKLGIDNKNFFAFNFHDKPKILLVDGNPQFSEFKGEIYFLRTAMSEDAIVKVINYDQFDNEPLNNYSIIFLCNVAELNRNNVVRLNDFTLKGNNLIFFLGDKINLANYNSNIASLLPCELNSIVTGGELSANLGLFENVDVLKNIQINKRFILNPKESSETLLKFTDNTPFLIRGKNNVYVYAISSNLSYSDIPVKPLFPILVKQLLGYFSSKEVLTKNIIVGKPFTESLEPNISSIIFPDGKIVKTSVNYFDTPGIYEIKFKNNRSNFISVNLDIASAESDLRKISIVDLKKSLGKTFIGRISADKYFEKNIKKILYGSEISKLLILLLLLLFILETILANPRKE